MVKKDILKFLIAVIFFIISTVVPAIAQPLLSMSSVTVDAGDTFQLMVTLDADGEQISALSTDISFDDSVLQLTGIGIGPDADVAGKIIMYNQVDNNTYRIGILSLNNNDTIGNGIVAYINGTIDNSASPKITILSQNASGSDPHGLGITISGSSANLTIGEENTDYPENFLVMTDAVGSFTVPSGSYYQIFGSTDANTINVETGARVDFKNSVGSNVINIEETSSQFIIYRSGATVYLNSNSGTLIKIAANLTSQMLRFADGSSNLRVSSGNVILGTQIVLLTESNMSTPVDTVYTSTSVF